MDRVASLARIQKSKPQTRRFAGCWKKRSRSCRTLTEPFSCCATWKK